MRHPHEFKSSYSGTQGDSRVEVAVTEQAIRDCKDMTRPHIVVDRDGWSRFVGFAAEA
ncbi:DUF397 domain-containing protein [Streptomyces albogriseolus]|uniref:DUF397 domain-containing protein n=1 Tax=Streptomyces albogriseolus TaxID=1887 RepID=UPI003516A7A6